MLGREGRNKVIERAGRADKMIKVVICGGVFRSRNFAAVVSVILFTLRFFLTKPYYLTST